jgi:hypothetical protein
MQFNKVADGNSLIKIIESVGDQVVSIESFLDNFFRLFDNMFTDIARYMPLKERLKMAFTCTV